MTTEIFKALASMAKAVATEHNVPCRVKELDVLDSTFMALPFRVTVSVSDIQSKYVGRSILYEATVGVIIQSTFDNTFGGIALANDFCTRFRHPVFAGTCLVSEGVRVDHRTHEQAKQTIVTATYRGIYD